MSACELWSISLILEYIYIRVYILIAVGHVLQMQPHPAADMLLLYMY